MIMNILYVGGYLNRFKKVIDVLSKNQKVLLQSYVLAIYILLSGVILIMLSGQVLILMRDL